MDTALHCSVKENRGRAQASLFVYLACTDLAFMLCVFYAEPRISRVPISSGRARTISRNLVHSLKAKSVRTATSQGLSRKGKIKVCTWLREIS